MGKYYWERYLDDPELCLSTRAFLNQFDKKPSIIKKVLKFLFRRKPKMKPKTDWSHVWIEKDEYIVESDYKKRINYLRETKMMLEEEEDKRDCPLIDTPRPEFIPYENTSKLKTPMWSDLVNELTLYFDKSSDSIKTYETTKSKLSNTGGVLLNPYMNMTHSLLSDKKRSRRIGELTVAPDSNDLFMSIEDENEGNKYVLLSNIPMKELPIEPEEEVVQPIELTEPSETFYKELEEITEEMKLTRLSSKFKEAVDNIILDDKSISTIEKNTMNIKLFLTTYGLGSIEPSYNKILKTKNDGNYIDKIEKDLKDLAEESKKISKKLEEDLDTTRKDLLTILI